MSKLIVEMEMPLNCKKCPLVGMDHFGQIRCNGQGGRLIHLKNFQTEIERPSWCPIKGELPEQHGDLVDADTVLWGEEVPDSEGIVVPVTVGDVIEGYDVPIIIAAERKDDEQIH